MIKPLLLPLLLALAAACAREAEPMALPAGARSEAAPTSRLPDSGARIEYAGPGMVRVRGVSPSTGAAYGWPARGGSSGGTFQTLTPVRR